MKVIDLLNKIANGEINENTLIEFDNGYKDYCSVRMFFDRYIMDRENLNCEVKIIEEDKKIEKIGANNYKWNYKYDLKTPQAVVDNLELVRQKINEMIDYINKEK